MIEMMYFICISLVVAAVSLGLAAIGRMYFKVRAKLHEFV